MATARTICFSTIPRRGAYLEAITKNSGTFTLTSGRWAAGWTVTVLNLNGDASSDVLLYNSKTGAGRQGRNTGSGAFTFTDGTWGVGWQVFKADMNASGKDGFFLYNAFTGSWGTCVNTGATAITRRRGRRDCPGPDERAVPRGRSPLAVPVT